VEAFESLGGEKALAVKGADALAAAGLRRP
jgi:hypothetical protein